MNTITVEEKEELVRVLQDNQDRLLSTLDAINGDLFLHKSSEDEWSIAELIEHIILVENGVLKGIQKSGITPSEQEIQSALDHTQMKEKAQNRSRKVKAPDPFIPKNIFSDKQAAIEAFKAHRKSISEFINTTTLPLKQIGFPHFTFGMLNGMSWFLFMAEHCERHILQMKEIEDSYK